MPVLMTKIPEDVRLLVGREIKDGEWNISEILKLLRNKWSMFCKQQHPTASCHVVTNKMARKKCLKKQGRCLICLKKSHLARDCRSKISCFKCSGRHHVSLCEIEPPTTETSPVSPCTSKHFSLGVERFNFAANSQSPNQTCRGLDWEGSKGDFRFREREELHHTTREIPVNLTIHRHRVTLGI